jgi:hypothetical protein
LNSQNLIHQEKPHQEHIKRRKKELPGQLLAAICSAMVELSATYKKDINRVLKLKPQVV